MEPGISGLETAKEIINYAPKTKIILVSGFSEIGMAQQALDHGVKKLIQKPYSVTTLGTAVREILEID
jgi:YesN/AraC family two-component response regulator